MINVTRFINLSEKIKNEKSRRRNEEIKNKKSENREKLNETENG